MRLVAAGVLTLGLPQDPKAYRPPPITISVDSQALLDEERAER
jgi:hypothetical protein